MTVTLIVLLLAALFLYAAWSGKSPLAVVKEYVSNGGQ